MEDVAPKANIDWSIFNRWCDDYADRHSGMKPKVEDVRKWHRENAEKVWPDNSERPSVFLAVSHNKGRRVRGHKTCEYYKRYRAGKAAEQQLAARLQPAALSGRRILAVTAAARKVNTDCTRPVAKRLSPDILADPRSAQRDAEETEVRGLEGQLEKRRRMRAYGSDSGQPGAGARGSSSDGLSEDPSWASGAGTSNGDVDEDGDSGSGPLPPGRRCPAHPFKHPHVTAVRGQGHGPHAGVHITVVRRDADGRTIRVETQPARRVHSEQRAQLLHRYYVGHRMTAAAVAATGDASLPGGALRHPFGLAASSQEHGGRDPGRRGKACDSHDSGSATTEQEHQQGAFSWPDGVAQSCSTEQQPLQSGSTAVAQDWSWSGEADPMRGDHPGIPPGECRRTRSCSAAGQQRRPRFSGYVATPIGSVPVYKFGDGKESSSGGSGGAGVRRPRHAQSDANDVPGGAPALGPAVRDPLDLLAEAACDALDSPRPAGHDGDGNGVLGCAESRRVAAPASTPGPDDAAAGEAVAGAVAPDAVAIAGMGGGAARGSDLDYDRQPRSADAEETRVKGDSSGDSASLVCGGVVSGAFVAARGLGQGWQQEQQLRQGASAGTSEGGAMVKEEPGAGGTERGGGPTVTGGSGSVSVPMAPDAKCWATSECGGSRGALLATGRGFGSGAKHEHLKQSPKPPFIQGALDALVPPPTLVPLFREAQRSPSRLSAVAVNEGASSADAPAAELVCGDCASGRDAAGTTAAAAAPQSAAGACGISSCRLPLMNAAELEANLLAALGQQPRLPLNGQVGVGVGPVGMEPASPAPPPALPLPICALTSVPPTVPEPLLWPALAGGMGPILAGAPALTAAAAAVAPLIADASVLGGALAGAGGGGSGQLLPMMRMLQMQMTTRGLDANAYHN